MGVRRNGSVTYRDCGGRHALTVAHCLCEITYTRSGNMFYYRLRHSMDTPLFAMNMIPNLAHPTLHSKNISFSQRLRTIILRCRIDLFAMAVHTQHLGRADRRARSRQSGEDVLLRRFANFAASPTHALLPSVRLHHTPSRIHLPLSCHPVVPSAAQPHAATAAAQSVPSSPDPRPTPSSTPTCPHPRTIFFLSPSPAGRALCLAPPHTA